jgi:quercetin dioxygenase-like cupin family protein
MGDGSPSKPALSSLRVASRYGHGRTHCRWSPLPDSGRTRTATRVETSSTLVARRNLCVPTTESVCGLKERQSMYRTTIDPTAARNDPALAPYFTRPALQQVLTSPESSPGLEVWAVFFGRGARSRWHRQPSPQIICVLSGVGLLGIDAAEQEVRPGEVMALPAQVWHWHGGRRSALPQLLTSRAESRRRTTRTRHRSRGRVYPAYPASSVPWPAQCG